MSSIRQNIITFLTASLAQIRTRNGYSTDAGATVLVWRSLNDTAEKVPCLLLKDTELTREYVTDAFGSDLGMVRNRLSVGIVAMASGATTAEQARAMELDLIQCLHADASMGGLAESVQITRSDLHLERFDTVVGGLSLSVAITYQSERNEC